MGNWFTIPTDASDYSEYSQNEEEEDIFHDHFDMPDKDRMIALNRINRIEQDDRVSFTECSTQNKIETEDSKYYVNELKFEIVLDTLVRITVGCAIDDTVKAKFPGYILRFYSKSDELGTRQYLRYNILSDEKFWETECDQSKTPLEKGLEKFKHLLKIHQRTIKKLEMSEIIDILADEYTMLKDYDLEIKSLDSLEHLEIFGDFDVQQIISKLKCPLKTFSVGGTLSHQIEMDFTHLYETQEKVIWGCSKLDYQQLQKLNAKEVVMSVGNLTEREIASFIQTWQDGTIGKEIKRYQWILDGSDFNILKLFMLFKIFPTFCTYEIKHHHDAGKRAKLQFGHEMTFKGISSWIILSTEP